MLDLVSEFNPIVEHRVLLVQKHNLYTNQDEAVFLGQGLPRRPSTVNNESGVATQTHHKPFEVYYCAGKEERSPHTLLLLLRGEQTVCPLHRYAALSHANWSALKAHMDGGGVGLVKKGHGCTYDVNQAAVVRLQHSRAFGVSLAITS